MSASTFTKIKLREVNRHLVCRLCRGYYVDATTIAECLHSFCRSCIIKYLEKNSFCPICEVQIHKTKPYLNLRLDKALQDVVYKLVPGLYHDEMKRRRDFYSKHQGPIPFTTPEQCGLEERIIFSPEDSISLSLEYLESDDYESETMSSQSSESGDNPESLSFPQQLGLIKLKNENKSSRRESQDVQETSVFPKRYLQCPAVVNIGHLKKFVRMKQELTEKVQVNIFHKRVPLPDHYTLMDVAYIFTWKRNSPLRFYYQIYQTRRKKIRAPFASSESENIRSINEKVTELQNGDVEKISESDLKKLTEVKNISDVNKSELIVSENNQKIINGDSGCGDSTKISKDSKSGSSVEVEKNVNSVKAEPVEKLEKDANSVTISRVNNSDKATLNGDSFENKSSVEPSVTKGVKTENSVNNSKEIKISEVGIQERFLLNPISGKLESVSSNKSNETLLNGTARSEAKNKSEKEIKEEPVKVDAKNTENQSVASKKSNVNLLKSFRKEKLPLDKDNKSEVKNNRASFQIEDKCQNSLTITTVSKVEKPKEKPTSEVSVEIKSESKESEYDFDGSSPPGKIVPLQEFSKYSKYSKYMSEHRDKWLSKEPKKTWMSLEDFREKMLKTNDTNEEDAFKNNKRKVVPSLYKINAHGSKMSGRKTPNDKQKSSKMSPTIINIKTDDDNKNKKVQVEVVPGKATSPPLPIKINNKNGEYSIKPVTENKLNEKEVKNSQGSSDLKKSGVVTLESTVDKKIKENGEDLKKKTRDKSEKIKADNISANGAKKETLAIDLTKGDTPKSSKNLVDELKTKTSSPGRDEKMMEALLAAAQKQNIDLLLKVPNYPQSVKNSMSPSALSPNKNISSTEITQALQLLENLRSDMKVLEGKNHLNSNSVLEQFTQKSANFEPYQQLYQQKIDLIRRLKRHQQMNESDTPQRKHLKLSPTSESKKSSPTSEHKTKTSPVLDDVNQCKSLDRTLSQMQLIELQSRMLAAHNYKNLLQYYNRPSNFCPGPTSPSKSNQQKIKPSSHSPNKSPQSLSSSSGNSPLLPVSSESPFFNSQTYSHLINAGLNSEMTYHQMFQSYLNQQEQMNQVKLAQMQKKPIMFNDVSQKSFSDKFFPSPNTSKKQDLNASVPTPQTT